jgi:UDP-N-acetylglucosamine--dolichyl-phosphate N-acetylglucosaminephosphotransferase
MYPLLLMVIIHVFISNTAVASSLPPLLLPSAWVAFFVVLAIIPGSAEKLANSRAKLQGRDLAKAVPTPVPESLGLPVGLVYIAALTAVQVYPGLVPQHIVHAGSASAALMLLVGFVDDVVDLRWSVKIALSLWALGPLLVAYTGSTWIVLPGFARSTLGNVIDLGLLYHVYMATFSVFCTNAINIYAGINGLEVGQSIVIGVAVLIHSLLEAADAPLARAEANLLAASLVTPFLAVSLGLYVYNRYPSKVFIGDSYTYFAGQVLGMCGILGHFPKTLVLFFLPQLANFILSLPQLFRIIPCPRHRVPRLNVDTGLMEATPNLTLINAWLYAWGPRREDQLVNELLLLQVASCAFGFLIRYRVAEMFYPPLE